MRNFIVCLVALLFILVPDSSISAQVLPGPTSGGSAEMQRRREEADLSRRMRDLHTLEQRLRVATRKPRTPPAEPKLSDEARERVLRLRRVADLDLTKYESFLKQDKTGIFKLFPDLGCLSKNVIRVSGECEKFVPLSSSFTFRTNGYGDELYHDIHFKPGRVSSTNFFSQGIFCAIGDEPIEGIGLTHPALKFLTSYEADVDPKLAGEHARQFRNGLDAGGFRYTDSFDPRPNVTYAMRMIAYRLENGLRPISDETSMNEMMFHSLTFDKRVDSIVAFRVLGQDEHGGLTIVWKELSRNDASKIKFGKNQSLRDFGLNAK